MAAIEAPACCSAPRRRPGCTASSRSRRARGRQLPQQQVMLAPQSAPGRPTWNADSRDGYRAARDRVFDMTDSLRLPSVAVLTGDVHSSLA
ncbi:MAG: alkaline phosphatase D family protein [Vicinamibacterales bacterium]